MENVPHRADRTKIARSQGESMPRHKKKASSSRSPYPSNAGHRTHRNFPQDVAREILRAFRYGRDLTLLMIEVTRPKGMPERLAYKGADSLSRFFEPHLRNTDFHFSSSSDHLFLLLPETPEKGGLVLGSRLVEIFEKAPLPPSGDSLPGTSVVQIHAGVSAVGMGGHTELDLIATSEIATRAARLFSSPVVTLNQLVGGRFSLLEWVGLYSTLSETEVLVLSRVFERLRKEPFGFMQKIASQAEALSDRLKLDLDDRDALAFWIYALDLGDIAKAETHVPLPEIAEHSNRKKKLLFLRGLELFGLGTSSSGRTAKSRWGSPLAIALFRSTRRIQEHLSLHPDTSEKAFRSYLGKLPAKEFPPELISLLSETRPSDWLPFQEELRE
ncbi:hypothetical protein BOX24_00245 [Leptospirillum ferriphilum]|jgi:hypothetical protein|uniref:GGDEF domain-containing protein n=2 Tax=Leptospirillum ferriphilum TaxID=178606 RepID=A0A1V3SYM8_9BACT|nr:hypothetical protein BOX24_00245 [Leptospirillum ferriphilum]